MDLPLTTYGIATVLIGAVSFVFAMLGLGGGMLYVPIFTWLGFAVKPVAIPVGLLLNGLNTLPAFVRYARAGLVDFRGGTPAAIAALLLAPCGARLVPYVPRRTLLLLFAIAVLIAGVRSLATSGTEAPQEKIPLGRRIAIGSGVGGAAGFLGGLLGLGGGFIVAPMLMEMGYPTKEAAATTAYIVTFSSFSGFLGHLAQGPLDWRLATATIVAVGVGSLLGAGFMTSRAKPAWVKRLYGGVLLGVAAKLFHGLWTE